MLEGDLAVAVSHIERARTEAVRCLLADERSLAIARALMEGPLRPCELERLPGVARSTLYIRLRNLIDLGVLVAYQVTDFPRRVEYGLSEMGQAALRDSDREQLETLS